MVTLSILLSSIPSHWHKMARHSYLYGVFKKLCIDRWMSTKYTIFNVEKLKK